MEKDIRPSKKWQMKENKKHPYKSRLPCNVNRSKDYAIVDEDGKILERFRLKQTATNRIWVWKNLHKKPVKIIKSE